MGVVEHSRCFRAGRLIAVDTVKWLAQVDSYGRAYKIPFRSLQIHSDIPIGFGEIASEDTYVQLIGDAVNAMWDGMQTPPQVGDEVVVNWATCYCRNGVMCCRVTDPSGIYVVPQAIAASPEATKQYQEVEAMDFFRSYFASKNSEK